MTGATPLTRIQWRRIAAEALVCAQSVRDLRAGRPVRGATVERLRQAAERLGLSPTKIAACIASREAPAQRAVVSAASDGERAEGLP